MKKVLFIGIGAAVALFIIIVLADRRARTKCSTEDAVTNSHGLHSISTDHGAREKGESSSAEAEPNFEYFASQIEKDLKGGDTCNAVERCTLFWLKHFDEFLKPLRSDDSYQGVKELDRFYTRFKKQYEEIRPPDPPLVDHIFLELESRNNIAHVGTFERKDSELLKLLEGSFSLSLELSNAKSLPSLLSVLSANETLGQRDIFAYRIFKENYIIGELRDKLVSEDDKAYTNDDIAAIEELARHPNPVARLAVLESIQWIRLPELQHERFSKLVGSAYLNEENRTVQRELVDYAYRNRDANSLRVLESLQELVAEGEQELREDLERTITIVQTHREKEE